MKPGRDPRVVWFIVIEGLALLAFILYVHVFKGGS